MQFGVGILINQRLELHTGVSFWVIGVTSDSLKLKLRIFYKKKNDRSFFKNIKRV